VQLQPRGYDLDLSKMDIDALVTLALEVRYPPARQELVRRSEDWKDNHIGILASHTPLSPEDSADARQQGVLWVEETLRTYALAEMDRPHGCHIRAWLEQVVTHRFADFLRAWRRNEKHLDRSRTAADTLDSAGNPLPLSKDGGTSGSGVSEPEAVARRHEWDARLAQALAELDPQLRRVWSLMCDGKCLPEVGEALGIFQGCGQAAVVEAARPAAGAGARTAGLTPGKWSNSSQPWSSARGRVPLGLKIAQGTARPRFANRSSDALASRDNG
jgi:RNA polymerase sigma factor (sigma-70 family)